ncbi:MAG TPA: ATP-binding protein [Gaiellaceae bacterium]|nr:ATP-binding protein [Gaiellaceae bacterium]
MDEAHNYVPERTTGFMAEAARHGSLGALTTIAVEGRKFRVGLVVISQRPSRVAKDVLAQMNSQLVFRLANLEDLAYVRESFEAAGEELLADLPRLDTGVCVCAGTMVAMPVRCDVPLYAPRHRFPLGETRPDRRALETAVAHALPEAELLAEVEELIVFSGPEAEEAVRAVDGGYALDVDCADPGVAERVRAAVETLATPKKEASDGGCSDGARSRTTH